jgi:hypothetical protein
MSTISGWSLANLANAPRMYEQQLTSPKRGRSTFLALGYKALRLGRIRVQPFYQKCLGTAAVSGIDSDRREEGDQRI